MNTTTTATDGIRFEHKDGVTLVYVPGTDWPVGSIRRSGHIDRAGRRIATVYRVSILHPKVAREETVWGIEKSKARAAEILTEAEAA